MKIYEHSCRICLVNTESMDEDEKWISIEEIDSDDVAICDKITLCTGININRDSILAKSICKPCTEHLRSAFDFQKICKQSDYILQDYIKNNIKLNENESNYILPSSDKSSLQSAFYPNVKVEITSNSEPDENSDYQNDFSSINDCEEEEYKPTPTRKFETKPGVRKKSNANNSDKLKALVTTQKLPRRSRPMSTKKDLEEENLENYRNFNSEDEPIERKKRKNSKKDEKESFICELCGNVYKKRALLSDHMRWHSGEKEFQCEICKKSFLLATYLARHMKTHTGIRNFQCSFCSRTFYTNGLKRAHEKVHTGERQYPCKLCDRSFSYSQSLQRHMMVHSGVKPFKCDDCGKEFRQETHLKQHLSTNIHQAKTAAALQNT